MKRLKTILGIVVASLFLGCSTALVFAEAGDPGGVTGGACGDYWDTCFGATWQYYATDKDTVTIPTDGHVTGGTITGCGKYGGYYRLGLATHRNGVRQALSGGKTQAGMVRVHEIYSAGGTRVGAESSSSTYIWFREGDPYGESWATTYDKFQVAAANNATNGFAWRDVSWFCYDKTWDNPGSKFVSKSTVNVPAQTGVTDPGSVTSEEDGEAMKRVTTTEEEFTATFWHEIFYKNGLTSIPSGATFADVTTGWTVSESGGQNRNQVASGTYTTNGGANASSGQIGQDTITIQLQENEKVTICHRITYSNKNITFGSTANGNYTDPQYSDQGSSRACVEVTRSPDPNKPAGEGGFWSTSTVKVPQQNDVPGYEATTGESKTDDREVEIKFSTDKDSVQVTFEHNMYYDEKLWKYSAYQGEDGKPVSSKDTFPDVCSNYTVTWEGKVTGQVKKDKHCTNKSGANSGKVVSTTTYTISGIQPDQPVTVCQKIDHDKLNVEMKRKAIYTKTIPSVFDHWEYSEGSSDGTGWTKACVTVTRPSEPEENENSITSGGVNNWIKYAGETSDVGWNPKAISQASRRLAEYKAINYLVPASVQYYADITKGNIGKVYPERENKEPCRYYGDKPNATPVWCDVLNDGKSPVLQTTLNLGPVRFPHSLTGNGAILGGGSASGRSATIAVPDYVGYKYCNSFGYRWEYWYSITKNGQDAWQKETRVSDYWTNYNAACRTIAKKPSAAAWNGGVLTNGGIKATTSPRILGVSESGPQAATPGQFNFVYGSWSEYLAVIGGISDIFASGDMFSRGSISKELSTNSPLTIANSGGSIGGSGITTSQALRTRLDSYLKNHPNSTINDVYSSSTSTRIVTVSGNLNITSNIVYPTQNYTNIYQLPQNVIFVDGDITISPDVRRIDAWIIATGNINTCTVREAAKGTATAAVGWNQNTVCDQQLVFNGPVMAGSVTLNRTYGSDPTSAYSPQSDRHESAEIFNLSASTYLWAYAQAGRYDSSYTEAYSRELAPRY